MSKQRPTVPVPEPLTKDDARQILAEAVRDLHLAELIESAVPVGEWSGYDVLSGLRVAGYDVVRVQS